VRFSWCLLAGPKLLQLFREECGTALQSSSAAVRSSASVRDLRLGGHFAQLRLEGQGPPEDFLPPVDRLAVIAGASGNRK